MADLKDWRGCAPPKLSDVSGRYVRVVPYNSKRHADSLFRAIGGAGADDLWRFIPEQPPLSADALAESYDARTDWKIHVLLSLDGGSTLGTASYMRIRPDQGSAEIGNVIFSPALKRTPAATEAMFLMARHLFEDLKYRRYEWKCDDANAPSKRAAERLGFSFEGVFRQDRVVKGLNRDTAWFSMLDCEWPKLKVAFNVWLDPKNFDPSGAQIRRLEDLR